MNSFGPSPQRYEWCGCTKNQNPNRNGFIYTLGNEPNLCKCGRTFYPYDTLVIAVHGICIYPATLDAVSFFGIFVGSNSPFNSTERLDFSPPEPPADGNSNVLEGTMHSTDTAELFAAKKGIETAIRIVEAGFPVPKLAIKSVSPSMVRCMTEIVNPEDPGWIEARKTRLAAYDCYTQVQKTIDLAREKGIEVKFWLTDRTLIKDAARLADALMMEELRRQRTLRGERVSKGNK